MYVAISASIIVDIRIMKKCHQMKKLCERHITTTYVHIYTVGCKNVNVCNCDYGVGS